MKLYKLIGVIGLLSLASCSKDAEPTLGAPSTSQETSEPGLFDQDTPSESIQIELEATQDDESLRALYNLATDGSGALAGLDQIGTPELFTRVYIRRHENDGDRSAITVQNIIFKKDEGRNYSRYTGTVQVPVRTKNTVKYTIAAALLRSSTQDLTPGDHPFYLPPVYDRKDQLKYTLSTIDVSNYASEIEIGGAKKLLASVPYVTDWQDFPRPTTTAPTKVVLKFKPFGTIYRVRLYNDTDKDLLFTGGSITSNAFTERAMFNFAEGETSPSWEPDYGGVYAQGPATVEFDFSELQKIGRFRRLGPKQYSEWDYLLVFPRKISQPVRTFAVIKKSDNNTQDLNALSNHLLFATSEPMPWAKSISTTFVYSDTPVVDESLHAHLRVRAPSAVRPSKLALEYVADRSFNESGTGFVSSDEATTVSQAQVGYFSYVEAVQRFGSPLTIGGKRYSLPTASEMRSIFPPDMSFWGGVIAKSRGFSGTMRNEVEPNIKIGNSPESTYLADYRYVNSSDRNTLGTLYAVRLQDATDTYRSAFRYRVLNSTSGSKYLQVDCVWLGARAETIDQVSNPSFWQNNSSQMITKKFPLYGFIRLPGEAIGAVNTEAHCWTSTTMASGPHGSSYGLYFDAHQHDFHPRVALVGNYARLSVRPFIRD